MFTDFSMFHFNYFVYPVVIGYIQIPINFHIQNKQKVENVRLMTHTSLCVFFFRGYGKQCLQLCRGNVLYSFVPQRHLQTNLFRARVRDICLPMEIVFMPRTSSKLFVYATFIPIIRKLLSLRIFQII